MTQGKDIGAVGQAQAAPGCAPTLCAACESNNWEAVAAFASCRFGTVIAVRQFSAECQRAFDRIAVGRDLNPWSDSSWCTWIRNRVYDLGLMPAASGAAPQDIRVGCLLHVFFPFIYESEEMIGVLNRSEPSVIGQRIARSKMFTTAATAAPVDIVARRVAGGAA